VKILRPNEVQNPAAMKRLVSEAEILGRLAHPVVLRLFEAETSGEHPHLVLEHLEGKTLLSLLKEPLPLEQLLPLSLYICSALHYLEQEELVHLDIKPGNIVMGIPPRLIDFSVARSVADAKKIERPIGTDAYMAPEQCDPGRRGEIGPRTDIWGFGATLFHALSGKQPFPKVPEFDRDKGELIERFPQLEFHHAPLPNDVPKVLANVVDDCLQKDPADRPSANEPALTVEPLVATLPTRPILRLLRPKLR
jgi:eukaryotic-like serine/threonine-protein kinase